MGVNAPLSEGFYWLDNQIVKAFDKSGNLLQLFKITVNDDLTISCKKHSKYPKSGIPELENWRETANRIKPDFYT